VWLDRVKQEYGDNLDITWKNFSLQQINSKEGPEWKVWEQVDLHEARSLLASVAGEAARRQGADAFDRFHLALLTARHGGDRIALNEDQPLIEVAEKAGLDIDRFKKDLADAELVQVVAGDHEESAEQHGAFGTPTFVFEDGQSVYLKTFIPPEEESVAAFEHFVGLMSSRPYIGEVKRPQPPWPRGAV
jgi:predicted DsbA family dithiol-disulfide isomerase